MRGRRCLTAHQVPLHRRDRGRHAGRVHLEVPLPVGQVHGASVDTLEVPGLAATRPPPGGTRRTWPPCPCSRWPLCAAPCMTPCCKQPELGEKRLASSEPQAGRRLVARCSSCFTAHHYYFTLHCTAPAALAPAPAGQAAELLRHGEAWCDAAQPGLLGAAVRQGQERHPAAQVGCPAGGRARMLQSWRLAR